MPADILRDRETDAPLASGFADIAQAAAPDLSTRIQSNEREMGLARDKQARAREDERAAMETRAAALKPQIASVEQAMGQREQLAANRPPPLALPPPPSRKLTDFLAPVEGEQPENTISKLLQGVGLLASGFTGLRRGNASTALASMAGALKGWHEGDKERADREFGKWQAETDKLIQENRSLHKSYEDIMQDASTTIEQKQQLLRLKAIESGHEVGVSAFDRQNADEDVRFLSDYNKQLLTLEDHRLKLAEMHAEKERNREFLLELKKQTLQQKAKDQDQIVSQFTPEALKVLGQDWFINGKLPAGVGVGKAGAVVKALVTKAGIEWAKENGIDPMTSQTVRAEVASARNSLMTVRRQNAVQETAIKRLDGHLDALLKLSAMVPRSEMPAVNAAILRGETQYKGSPEAAAYVFQSLEASMEFARVIVPGNAQGDAATRDKAREAIAPSLANGQVKAVVEQMRQNAHRNVETNRASEKQLLDVIETVGGRIAGPPMPPPPAGSPDDPLGILTKPAVAEKK